MTNNVTESPYKGSGQITREQFLFFEMRIAAKLVLDGLEEDQIIERIVDENLFQFPTERSTKGMARTCVRRLACLEDDDLVRAIALQPADDAKQICLYAMMKQYRIIWDFMVSVIGAKYQRQDFTYSRRDINVFFLQLQEQDDVVASWAESTIKKIASVISKILIENEYIDNGRATKLNPVLISPVLENAIRAAGEERVLPVFNCLI